MTVLPTMCDEQDCKKADSCLWHHKYKKTPGCKQISLCVVLIYCSGVRIENFWLIYRVSFDRIYWKSVDFFIYISNCHTLSTPLSISGLFTVSFYRSSFPRYLRPTHHCPLVHCFPEIRKLKVQYLLIWMQGRLQYLLFWMQGRLQCLLIWMQWRNAF